MELKPYTWYYDTEGRTWAILAVLLKDVTNQTVWMLQVGKEEPVEHKFHIIEKLILDGKFKLYRK